MVMGQSAQLDAGSPEEGPRDRRDAGWHRLYGILLTLNLIHAQQSSTILLHVQQGNMDPWPEI